MGLYDRGYIRDDYGSERETPLNLLSQKPMVILIVIFTVICYIVDFVTRHDLIFRWWSLTPQTWKQPLFYFQYLTYGFVHDPTASSTSCLTCWALSSWDRRLKIDSAGLNSFASI